MAGVIEDETNNSDCSEEVRPVKRRCIIEISSDSDDVDDVDDQKSIIEISSDSDDVDDDQSESDTSDFEWEEKNDTPKVHKFTADNGVNKDITDFTRENVYELFLNDEILQQIVTETNRYGKNSPSFEEITLEELKVYFALTILMSLIQKPTLQSYWSTDKSIDSPYFRTVMNRKRFMSISRNLHFVNNDSVQQDDSLKKIRPIIDMIRKAFKEVYIPSKNISLDGSSMQCRSRLHYVQCKTRKRTKLGIKFYRLCDAKTKYIHNFRIQVEKEQSRKELANTEIVLDMMRESNLLQKGYCLYIYNWYSSPDLYSKLFKLKTNVCGIARINRKGIPKTLEKRKLKRGEAIIMQCKNISAIKWERKKDIVLSTMHALEFGDMGKRNYKTNESIIKPTVLIDYSKNMAGIDGNEQLLGKFHTMRRYHKAYKNIFFYCLDMIILNSYVIFRILYKDRAFHIFKQKLAEEIIEKNIKKIRSVEKKRKITVCPSLSSRFSGQHFPILIETASSKKARKRCVVCLSQKKRKETISQCDNCQVALCIEHFKYYHTVQND